MKKCVLVVVMGSLFLVFVVKVDMLLGIYVGVQGWNIFIMGGFFESLIGSVIFNFDDEINMFFYVVFEYFVLLVLNVKVNYISLDSKGNIDLQVLFDFDGNMYEENMMLLIEMNIDIIDFILYYEIFDNDLVSFDIGVNGKYIDGILYVEDVDSGESGEMVFKGIILMVYSCVQVGLLFIGLFVYVEGSYLLFDDYKVSDFQVVLIYLFVENLVIDMIL